MPVADWLRFFGLREVVKYGMAGVRFANIVARALAC